MIGWRLFSVCQPFNLTCNRVSNSDANPGLAENKKNVLIK